MTAAPDLGGRVENPDRTPLAESEHGALASGAPLDLRRFVLLDALIAAAFSMLAGSARALELGFGLTKFGGLEYVGRVVAVDAVRELGPGCSVSAALLAVLVWTHPLEPDAVQARLLRAAPWVLLATAFAAPLATALVVVSGFLTTRGVFAVPWEALLAGRSFVELGDIPAAAGAVLVGLAVVAGLSWFALPAMAQRRWPLPAKIAASYGALVLIRLLSAPTLALLGSE